jgi:hypothetical protein
MVGMGVGDDQVWPLVAHDLERLDAISLLVRYLP